MAKEAGNLSSSHYRVSPEQWTGIPCVYQFLSYGERPLHTVCCSCLCAILPPCSVNLPTLQESAGGSLPTRSLPVSPQPGLGPSSRFSCHFFIPLYPDTFIHSSNKYGLSTKYGPDFVPGTGGTTLKNNNS